MKMEQRLKLSLFLTKTRARVRTDATGLPGLDSWPSVYVIVLGIFLLWIGLLTVFTEFFS